MNAATARQETLFSYGLMRDSYARADTPISEPLHIRHFVHPQFRQALLTALSVDRQILSHTPSLAEWQALSPVTRQCVWELHSGIMLRLLENLTGCHNLLPDSGWQTSRLCQGDTPALTAETLPAANAQSLPCALLVRIALTDNATWAAGDAWLERLPTTSPSTPSPDEALCCVYFISPVAEVRP